jgi:hypothetical protein
LLSLLWEITAIKYSTTERATAPRPPPVISRTISIVNKNQVCMKLLESFYSFLSFVLFRLIAKAIQPLQLHLQPELFRESVEGCLGVCVLRALVHICSNSDGRFVVVDRARHE